MGAQSRVRAAALFLALMGGQGLEWEFCARVISSALELSGSDVDHAGLTSLG